jgi:hypothetical protein
VKISQRSLHDCCCGETLCATVVTVWDTSTRRQGTSPSHPHSQLPSLAQSPHIHSAAWHKQNLSHLLTAPIMDDEGPKYRLGKSLMLFTCIANRSRACRQRSSGLHQSSLQARKSQDCEGRIAYRNTQLLRAREPVVHGVAPLVCANHFLCLLCLSWVGFVLITSFQKLSSMSDELTRRQGLRNTAPDQRSEGTDGE